MNDILNMELTEEQQTALVSSLEEWKESVYSEINEELEASYQTKVEELEEASIAYRETLKEEYSDKLIEALNDMRAEIKAEVVSEMTTNDPSFKILEEIKKLVAPTLNEEYVKNVYLEELTTLREQVETYKREEELAEGAEVLESLIENYTDEVKILLRTLINEGTAEEVREKYWEIVEGLEVFNEDEDEDEEDDEYEDEEDESEEETEEESSTEEDEEIEEETKTKKKGNSLREEILSLV